MGWLRLGNTRETKVKDISEQLRHYRELRAAQQRMHSEALSFLSRKSFKEGAKELGVLRGDRLVFRSEHEMAVTVDHCLYDLRRNGRTAIDRYLAQTRFEEGTAEFELAAAMRRARYSIFVVEEVQRGAVLSLRDLFRQEPVRLLDQNLSETAKADVSFASRILLFEDFAMTTGAALPFDKEMGEELSRRADPRLEREIRKGLDVAHMTPEQQARFATLTIRVALDLGAGERIVSH